LCLSSFVTLHRLFFPCGPEIREVRDYEVPYCTGIGTSGQWTDESRCKERLFARVIADLLLVYQSVAYSYCYFST
jgi:hypothetical protein